MEETGRKFGAILGYSQAGIATYSAPLLASAMPDSYDLETEYPEIPRRMFANGRYGCCVMATRADMTMFFERVERGTAVIPTDEEVAKQYFLETKGRDAGLVLATSLRQWKSTGWIVGGRRLRIQSFAKIGTSAVAALKQAIWKCQGIAVDVAFPYYAAIQWSQGVNWTYTAKPKWRGMWGAHAMHGIGYSSFGVKFRTWNTVRWMDWRFLAAHAYGCYACIDARN